MRAAATAAAAHGGGAGTACLFLMSCFPPLPPPLPPPPAFSRRFDRDAREGVIAFKTVLPYLFVTVVMTVVGNGGAGGAGAERDGAHGVHLPLPPTLPLAAFHRPFRRRSSTFPLTSSPPFSPPFPPGGVHRRDGGQSWRDGDRPAHHLHDVTTHTHTHTTKS